MEQPRRENLPRGNGTLDLAGVWFEGGLSELETDHPASKLSGSLGLVSAGARGTARGLSQECARAGAAQSRGAVSERGSGVSEHSRG